MIPTHADAHNGMGVTLDKKGDLQGKLQCYAKAIQINPEHAAAHRNMGLVLRQQGKLNEALKHYKEAIRIDPNYADAHINMGVTLDQERWPTGGVAVLRQGHPDQPRTCLATHKNMGRALHDQGKLNEALKHYKEAIRIDPNCADAHNGMGVTLDQEGWPTREIAVLRQGHPDQPRTCLGT